MIQRYTRPEMGAIWSDENRYRLWLKVEIAVCEAQAEFGRIPAHAVEDIKTRANFSVERIEEIEQTVKHDVIAFLTNVAEHVGPNSRYIHWGMTSSDILDTALALQVKEAGAILLDDVEKIREVLKRQALAHKKTLCIGRSHGIHAEPTTLGLKFALWYDEMGRNQLRLNSALERIGVGMLSGAVGTYAFVDPRVEERMCQILGLKPVAISTQVIQRDIHAEFIIALALIGSTLEKIAVEIRHLQRTEVLEAEEPFTKGQKGSSAMPHKRNPIGSENISGLSRLLRTNAIAAMENIALWHERDISHSSVERVIFPDSTILADYALARMMKILGDLVVYPDNMLNNLRRTKGLIYSQALLLALTEAGMLREDAYKVIQENAMVCWRQGKDFKTAVSGDKRVLELLSKAQIDACFDEKKGLNQVDYIFRRVGIE